MISGNVDDRDAAQTGRDLFQQIQPLSPDRRLEIVEAGDISAGDGAVRTESASDRIGHPGEDDRDGARRVPALPTRLNWSRQISRWSERDLLGHAAHPFLAFPGEPVVEADVAALSPAEFLQAQKVAR